MNPEHVKRPTTILALVIFLCAGGTSSAQTETTVNSPDGRVGVDFRLDAEGLPLYTLRLEGRPVLRESRRGGFVLTFDE